MRSASARRGSPSDLEVLDVSAGEMAVTDSSVDLSVAAVNRGGAGAFDLRVLENGRPIDLRRVVPAADGGPVRAVFTVSPSRDAATLYTVEIPSAPGERVLENNRRSVLVEPAGRRRAVLMIEGAPGFEHSFIKRALAADPGLEVDSVVRKGRDATGAATYFVQASEARASRLAAGFPQEREALYEYDALVLANVEADALSRAQLQMIADFVDVRGGGLLVLGAKSFVQQGFAGTPLESVLPLRLTDRGGGVVRVSSRQDTRYAVTLTADGASHPVMRLGAGCRLPNDGHRCRRCPARRRSARCGPARRRSRSCGRPTARGRWSRSSATDRDARWSSPARRRGAGACRCLPRTAPTNCSGARPCAGSAPAPPTACRSPPQRASCPATRPRSVSTCAATHSRR